MRFAFLALVLASCAAASEPVEALAEVNRQRAARGLPAYQYDAGLTQGAAACAAYRAEHQIHGHTRSDFAFLPPGVHADAGGCAAWRDGFGACAMFERQYKTAGAAFVVGKDGLRYCELFVRKGPPTSVRTTSVQEEPSSRNVRTTNVQKTVHCIQYTDASKKKIAREWDEPAPDWLK